MLMSKQPAYVLVNENIECVIGICSPWVSEVARKLTVPHSSGRSGVGRPVEAVAELPAETTQPSSRTTPARLMIEGL